MDANGLKADVPTGKTASPYRLIDETALRWHRRRLSEILLPAVPPMLAAAMALAAGRLPLEIGVAGTIALAIFGLYVTGLVVSRLGAARFLDRSLGAKDRFLTLATIEGTATLLSVVESGAAAIAASSGDLPLPPRRKRPLVASAALSVVGLLFLWVIPDLASLAGAGGGGLDRIAADLAAGDAADQELARVLRDVSNALHDPHRSNEEKRAKVAEALAKLEQGERKRQISAAGTAGGSGGKKDQGREQKADGNRQERGAGEQASGQGKPQQTSGTGNGEVALAARPSRSSRRSPASSPPIPSRRRPSRTRARKQNRNPPEEGFRVPTAAPRSASRETGRRAPINREKHRTSLAVTKRPATSRGRRKTSRERRRQRAGASSSCQMRRIPRLEAVPGPAPMAPAKSPPLRATRRVPNATTSPGKARVESSGVNTCASVSRTRIGRSPAPRKSPSRAT